MHTTTDLQLDQGAASQAPPADPGALVQDRPTLGTMPRARGGSGWLLPAIDLASALAALVAVSVTAGPGLFPSLLLPPLLLVFVHAALGVYTGRRSLAAVSAEDGIAWQVIRLLIVALFVW